MLHQLLTMLLALLLSMLPLPQLSSMLDIRSTNRSSIFPRSLSRSTHLPTPPTTSLTMLQSLVLSPDLSQLLVFLLLLLLLPLPPRLRLPQLLKKLKEPNISY